MVGCNSRDDKIKIIPYPAGYDFAFTITDDPDDGWLEQKEIVYDFLCSLNMKTSIGVWLFDNKKGSGDSPYYRQGISLENTELLKYTMGLKNKGFEIFLHTASGGNDRREETIRGFEKYKETFGRYPEHWINHSTNYENIYWGYKRFNNTIMRCLYRLYSNAMFYGDDNNSDYFWGDYCLKYIKYVRGWATDNLNTLAVNQSMPYHDHHKPYVKYWYGNSDGATCYKFNKLISVKNVDRLVNEQGTAIVYTHFASGFVDKDGKLNSKTKRLLSYIAKHKNGWFVPVSTILDRFIAIKKIKVIDTGTNYLFINTGDSPIANLVLKVYDRAGVIFNDIVYEFKDNSPSTIVLNRLDAKSVVILRKKGFNKNGLAYSERFKITWKWLISRLI